MNIRIRKFYVKAAAALILASLIAPVFEVRTESASRIIARPDLIMPPRKQPVNYERERRERERLERARWEQERRERDLRRREQELRDRERREAERREREHRDWEREQAYRRERERRDWERYERERRDYERRERKRQEDELAIEIIGEIIKEGMRQEAAKERRTRY